MPYKGQKKRIDPTKEHGYIGVTPSKKAPPRIIETPEWMKEYVLKRDRVIYSDIFTCEETKQAILERYAK